MEISHLYSRFRIMSEKYIWAKLKHMADYQFEFQLNYEHPSRRWLFLSLNSSMICNDKGISLYYFAQFVNKP